MLRHLIPDFLRRLWTVHAGACAALAIFWATAGSLPLEREFFFALSLAAAFVLGPMLAITQFGITEIFLLPVSRRDLWRAVWFLSTLAACASTLAAKLAGVAVGTLLMTEHPLGLSQVAISSLLDLAYVGLVIGVLLLLRHGSTGVSGWVGRALSAITIAVTTLSFVGGVLWGFLVQAYLPSEWSHLRGPALSLLVAGIGIAMATYFYAPPPGIRQASRGGEARARPATIARFGPKLEWLTGTRLMLVQETLRAAGASLMLIVFFAVLGTFIDPQQGLAEKLRAWRLLPFEPGDASLAIYWLVIYGGMMLNGIAPARDPLGSSPWRHLRVLPMTTADLIRLLLARRALGWLTIWTVLLIVHLAVTRSLPATLRPELLVVAIGADALIHALQVRWQRHPIGLASLALYSGMILVVGLVLVLPLRLLSEMWADTLLVSVGLAAMAVAAWILSRTLRGSSVLYARVPKAVPAGLF